MQLPVNPFNASVGNTTLYAGHAVLSGAVLIAAGASATAVVKRGGSSGEVVLRLSAAANTTATFLPPFVVGGSNFYVTVAGTGAEFTAYF